MTALTEGTPAPGIQVPDETGHVWRLDDLEGSPFVLYFYPRDDTPGCTAEAMSFQEQISSFENLGVQVLGVSDDDADSHRAFKDKHDLDFPLLADTDGDLADRYGVWVEKKMFGNEFLGVERTTFLVDANGDIARVWTDVDPEGHGKEVFQAVEALESS